MLKFTELEIAQLLDKPEAGIAQKKILVMHEGDTSPQEYDIIKLQKIFGFKYLQHLKFSSYAFFKETIRNCPLTLRSPIGNENRLLAQKYQKELDNGFFIDTMIKWINDEIGYGLFATNDIPAGTYIGEYTGLVRKLDRSRPDHNPYCMHYPTRFWSYNYFIIDALWQGNETRFINHSALPNLDPVCLLDRNLLHMCFLSNKPIPARTELTFDYGPDFWAKKLRSGLTPIFQTDGMSQCHARPQFLYPQSVYKEIGLVQDVEA